jgi:hypothetical protein
MNAQAAAPSALQSVVDRILRSRQITRLDQCLLLAVSETTPDDHRLISQVFDCLSQGRLRVVE